MYKLYLDKTENFECELSIKNASLKNGFAQLILETKDINLVFNGKINGDRCLVPIKKLKGVMEENTSGKMHLEVVVEDTYFKPWESEFIVEEHTSIKVQVKEQSEPLKPTVVVKEIINNKVDSKTVISTTLISKEIVRLCEKFGINSKNIKGEKRNDFKQLMSEYFKSNSEYNKDRNKIIDNISKLLK